VAGVSDPRRPTGVVPRFMICAIAGRMPRSGEDLTQLLERARQGSPDALDAVFPLIYDELRVLARRQIGREYGHRSVEATDLVHEAYLRLIPSGASPWQSRAHFFGIAARSMRQVLVDRARARHALKRGGPAEPVTLADAILDRVAGGAGRGPVVDLIALDTALSRLAILDARYVELVELRFFAGLGIEETARVMGASPATIKRWWTFAQTWLRRELGA